MNKITFDNTNRHFFTTVKAAVNDYFDSSKIKRTGNIGLYTKSILFISSAILIYLFILFGQYNTTAGITISVLFGLSLSCIAVNVMHDACHGSFSEKRWINNIMALTMNALGSNAFLWKIKHNVLHHNYTNIDGMDSDIANWPILRQSPAQKRLSIHRYQFIYMFPLYALTTIEWMLISDFTKYFRRKIFNSIIKKISLKEHFIFWISKFFYIGCYVLLPVMLRGWQHWLIGFLIVHFTMGLALTILFQLAHLVDNTRFEATNKTVNHIECEWAIHEIASTSNFATQNKFISWLVGGLNFQIEHHLFPRISHVHYPVLSKIIQEECHRHNLPYNCYPTLTAALRSHIRLMKRFGKTD